MPASSKPILIVNADDFGWYPEATDPTLEAFATKRITSATAMVHMADSDRGAELALEAKLPTGLHLNLTDPFDGSTANENQRERQLLACRLFPTLSPSNVDLRPSDPIAGGRSDQRPT